MAFCAWLSEQVGFEVRLPTEEEWERAARGTDGRVYPWGDKYLAGHANIDETGRGEGPHYLQRTSAVGIYPLGASPEGLLDLSGNVWEWCLNEIEGSRGWRGGGWGGRSVGARAGFRFRFHPNGRRYYLGFRVVCSSPIRGTLKR